jgi:DNA-directed RNA polymerase specialized sigma subunit
LDTFTLSGYENLLAFVNPDEKKVLAMYYYENMQLWQIAAAFGVTESRICQIRGAAVAVLRKYLTKLLA